MGAKGPFEIPVGMRKVCRRFERWRKVHKARLPIPAALWTAAAIAAREHGVFRAAKALHLEHGKLTRMVKAGAGPARVKVAPAAFLEPVPPQAAELAECLIELEGPRGNMRIQWRGATGDSKFCLAEPRCRRYYRACANWSSSRGRKMVRARRS
jgi:hypothetical protein